MITYQSLVSIHVHVLGAQKLNKKRSIKKAERKCEIIFGTDAHTALHDPQIFAEDFIAIDI